jgi:hypothetical protein
LEEGNQISFVIHDLPDKLFPLRAVGVPVIPYFCNFGDHVLLPVGQQFPRPQVDSSVLNVQKPGIAVKVIDRGIDFENIPGALTCGSTLPLDKSTALSRVACRR